MKVISILATTFVLGAPQLNVANGLASFNTCGHRPVFTLTFDDGPNHQTLAVLADLKRFKIRATFFVTPGNGGKTPTAFDCDLIRRSFQDGHDVQIHTWEHRDMMSQTKEDIKETLQKTKSFIEKCAGGWFHPSRIWFVRPPFGNLDHEKAKFISEELNYVVATWNVDSHDWKPTNTFQNIQNHFHLLPPGSSAIVLMHDRSTTSITLTKTVDFFQSLGYTSVTLADCYTTCASYGATQGYSLQPGVCTQHGSWPGTYANW